MVGWEEEEAELEKTLHVAWDCANPPNGNIEAGTQIAHKLDKFEDLLPAQCCGRCWRYRCEQTQPLSC